MKLTPLGTREISISLAATLLSLLVIAGLSASVTPHVGWLAIMPLAFIAWVVWFFRDPERIPPPGENLVLSPADGVVTHVGEVDEPVFVGEKALRVSIFMNVFNVHVNRAPLAGTVRHAEHHVGEYLNAMREDASHRNEHFDIGIETSLPGAPRMLVRQVAGLVARRIVCSCKPGDTVLRGERFGMIKFGSRLEVFLPVASGFSARVQVGDSVAAGETVLGEVSA